MSCHACGGRGYARVLLNPDGTVLARADTGFLFCTSCGGDQSAITRSSKLTVDTPPPAPLLVLAVSETSLESRLRALPTKKPGARTATPYPPLVSAEGVLADEHLERRRKALTQTSPSAIDLFDKCPRKWFFGYIVGDKEPQKPWQAAGQDIDDNYVQPHLLGAPKPDIPGKWQKLADELAKVLPKPGEAIVQAELRFKSHDDGPWVINYPDWLLAVGESEVLNEDLKTTSKKQYVKTRAELEDNTQLVSYAKGLHDLIGPEVVRSRHVYGIRDEKNPKVFLSPRDTEAPLLFNKEQADERWGPRVETIKEMSEAARGCASAQELTPNTEECSAWGGCHHRGKCGLVTNIFGKVRTSTMSETSTNGTVGTSAMMEKLRLRKLGQQAAAPAAGAPAPAAAAPAPVEEKIQSPMTLQDDSQVVPPDAPVRTSTAAEIETVDAGIKAKAARKTKKVEPAAAAPTPAPQPAVVDPDEDPEERAARELLERKAREKAEAKKRAEDAALEAERQKLRDEAENKKRIAEASAPLAAKLAEHQATTRATRKKPPEPPVLFIDCAPTKGATAVELADWLDPIEEAAVAAFVDEKGRTGYEDFRMISYVGDGVLAVAIRAALDTCPGALIIRSDSRAAKVALEVLIPHASLVVQRQ